MVDAILSGAHEPGSSHYDLLRAFASDVVLERMTRELEKGGYRSHEFGDSVLIEAQLGYPAPATITPCPMRISPARTLSLANSCAPVCGLIEKSGANAGVMTTRSRCPSRNRFAVTSRSS